MKRYRVSCVKNNEKVSLLIAGENTDVIKKELHKQGYSIIEILEDTLSIDDTGIFYFDVFINGVEKKGQKIKSNDILQAYIKLKDDLHYDIIAIYGEKDADEKEKTLTTNKIKESYRVYLSETEKKKKNTGEDIQPGIGEEKEENFLAKKEILNYVKLIDKVIIKISYILDNHKESLSEERIRNLELLYISLKKIRNITNINKLKIVAEKALLKIGEIEMELTDSTISEQKEDILNQTNQLLKEF